VSSYGEFLKLERAAIASEECQNYWRTQIDQGHITQLPGLRPNKHLIADECEQEFWISSEVTDTLKKLSQKHGLPLKSILLAGHMRVLAVLSGQRNVTSGVVWHGRPEEEGAERMIGLFLNTLPFVMEMERGSWLDLAQRAFAKEREMIPHRRYPLIELQRSQRGAALFEVAFNYIHFHVFQGALQTPGIRILETHSNTKTNFPLLVNFGLDPSGGNLQLAFQYDSSEFSGEQIRQFAGCYERALQAIANDPERDYRESLLVDPVEVAQELNQAREEYELEGTSLASWFEAVAGRRDEAVAVVCGNEQLSYRELNEQANQLGHYLRKLGVGPEQLVGVYLDRSLRMVVSLLGIIKAGGAYIPLEPSYPLERVNYMLADAGVKVMVSETAVAERLSDWTGAVVRVDAEWKRISEESKENPPASSDSENVAYVIYTSGTTGKPKGTLVTQQNAQRLLKSTERWYGFSEDDVWTLFHSYGFDVSVWEMWGALLYGGKLVVVPYLLSRTPEQFYELLQREQVTVLNQTPSAFWQLMPVVLSGRKTDLKLRLVIFAGEALAVSRLREW
jgi:non-ribosomal peptide synthetase component F